MMPSPSKVIPNPLLSTGKISGILPVDKSKGKPSFNLVRMIRRRFGEKKVGHAGTLDPFATGVMVMLIGRNYTRMSDNFLNQDKEYIAKLQLGVETDTYDCEGMIVNRSSYTPSIEQVSKAITHFQGEIEQVPPMFSAKKINGEKLYNLARQGKTVERDAKLVTVHTQLLSYEYPFLSIKVVCSKGTYIRSIANDLGRLLGCYAHLVELRRTRSGAFSIEDCLSEADLADPSADVFDYIRKHYENYPEA